MAELRVTQQDLEALLAGVAPLRVTQQGAEAPLLNATPIAEQITQQGAEPVVLFNPTPLRVTGTGLDIVIKVIPDEPVIPATTLEACDLLLEVFNDDRETVRWSVATTLVYSNPYLLMPERYAEQEIDPASGSATLGTVTVMIADVPQEAWNQNTGFLTGKLARQAVADIAGRRARLLRAVGAQPDTVLEVVIDGVAGTPRMDSSYAAFSFDVRDTREIERKVRAFDGNAPSDTVLLPSVDPGVLGTLQGYGYDADTDTYLLPPIVAGLTGTFIQNDSHFPSRSTGSVSLTGNPADQRTITLHTHAGLTGQSAEQGPTSGGVPIWERVRFPNLALWWRAAASSDPWTVIDGAHLVLDIERDFQRYNLATATTDLGNDLVRIDTISFGDDRVAGAAFYDPPYSPALPGAALPADAQAIELMIVSYGPASTSNPLHLDEGLTAGQFAKNMYDGVYSARDENGHLVASGIRYDAAALLAMTDPVRTRITEPITDARDYLEKYLYAPTGWIPALDRYGRISPVSQEAPEDILGLPLLYDAITEPAPNWDAGERIVNLVRFILYRDFKPDDADQAQAVDGLSVVQSKDAPGQLLEFLDPVSVQRHGPQVLEIDGRLFRAVGDPLGNPVLDGGATAETGYGLAFERRDHVLNRYSLGAPTMVVNVRRDLTPTLRAGSWVRVWLSWFPDYVTGERGLIALCQIVAIGDLDCVWRQVTMEQVLPLTLYDVDEDLRAALLTGKTSKILTGKSGQPLIATF